MKIVFKFTFVLMFFAVVSANAQYTELVLDPADVFAAPPHYDGTNGTNQSQPEALVNDPFSYDPNNPTAEYPVQGWKSDPEFSYYFPAWEREAEMHPTHPSFPRIGIDSAWEGITFDIPEGKTLAFLDVWGQDHLPSTPNHQNLVFILKSDDARYVYAGWSDVPRFDAPEQAYARFNLADYMPTDNIFRTATSLVISSTTRQGYGNWVRVSELRIGLEDDPYAADNTAPSLSNETSGDVLENRAILGTSDEIGTAYLVPDGSYAEATDVRQAMVSKVYCEAGEPFELLTYGIAPGSYKIIIVDGGDNVTEASGGVEIIADTDGPVLSSVTAGTMPVTSYLDFGADEEATVFLVPSDTELDSTAIAEAAVNNIDVVAGGSYTIETYGALALPHVLYGIDLEGNISAASDLIVLEALADLDDLAVISVTNPVLTGAVYYADKWDLGEYAFSDDFSYDPLNPTIESPMQGWDGEDTTSFCFASGDMDTVGLSCEFAPSAGFELYAMDIWGRKWATTAADETLLDEEFADRTQDLYLHIDNGTDVWEVPASWSGASTPENGAYGRFIFRTARVAKEALQAPGTLTIKNSKGGYLHIDEIRLLETAEINNPPVADAGPDQEVAPGSTVTLDGSGSTDPDGDELDYEWVSRSSDPIIEITNADAVDATFTAPTELGEYRFTLMVSDGDLESELDQVVITVGAVALDYKQALEVTVYPNPSDDAFFINLESIEGETMISVLSTTGQEIFNDITTAGTVYELSSNNLPRGTYMLQVQNNNIISTQKIIVE